MSQDQQTTTVAALKNPAPRETNLPAVQAGLFDLAGFELMQRVSKAFASSTLVPKDFQGNISNCMIALNLARRLRADELMVMQNLYIVHGRPGWSSKFLIATFNQCGRFTAMRFEFFGDRKDDTWGARAVATELSTGEKIIGPEITIGMAKAEGWHGKSGSKWKTIPELMLRYRAGGWLVNTAAPEISMGLSTQEELQDVIDLRADGSVSVSLGEIRSGPMRDIDPETGEVQQNTSMPAAGGTAGAVAGSADENNQQAGQGEGETNDIDPEKVKVNLERATDLEVLELAADDIRAVVDSLAREELNRLYLARREQIENPPQTQPKAPGRRAAAAAAKPATQPAVDADDEYIPE